MSYAVRYTKAAQKQLENLQAREQDAIMSAISRLADDPFGSPNVKALQGRDDLRLRVGRFRVFYFVETAELVVLVVEIANRKEAYR